MYMYLCANFAIDIVFSAKYNMVEWEMFKLESIFQNRSDL